MNRRSISLKSRVRYDEGMAQTIDRRADFEKLPNPIWFTVGAVLRKNFQQILRGRRGANPTPGGR